MGARDAVDIPGLLQQLRANTDPFLARVPRSLHASYDAARHHSPSQIIPHPAGSVRRSQGTETNKEIQFLGQSVIGQSRHILLKQAHIKAILCLNKLCASIQLRLQAVGRPVVRYLEWRVGSPSKKFRHRCQFAA